MTADEIFSKIASHMKQGVAMHCDMVQAYDFLSLYGFSKCHLYHYFCEAKSLACLMHYYSTHYHKLLTTEESAKQEIIPASWLKYTTENVDTNTMRQAVKALMEKWVKWEQDTKKLYQEMYSQLILLNEVAAAKHLMYYITDVDDELEQAEKKLHKLNIIDYSANTIISWQSSMHKKYKKKLGG